MNNFTQEDIGSRIRIPESETGEKLGRILEVDEQNGKIRILLDKKFRNSATDSGIRRIGMESADFE
jgi:hypothetical protein